jgi:hypothetical protein
MTEHTDRKPAPLPKGCELLEVLQYQCEIGTSQVICNPFVRVFARYKDATCILQGNLSFTSLHFHPLLLRCQGSPLYEVTPVDHADDPLYSR